MLQGECPKRLSNQEFSWLSNQEFSKSGCMSDLTIYFQAHPSPDELESIQVKPKNLYFNKSLSIRLGQKLLL